MRDAFSNALARLAVADPKVLLLTGDHGYALFDARDGTLIATRAYDVSISALALVVDGD